MNRLTTKVWLVFLSATAVSISIIILLSYYFYESIYVSEVQATLEKEAANFALEAEGSLSDELIEKVDDYNVYSTSEIFAVRNPRELSACLPFEINYDALISGEDRQQLVNGEIVIKRGYQTRFDSEILSVIYPIVQQERLTGILYSYVPLSPIQAFLQNHIVLVAGGGAAVFLLFALISRLLLQTVLKPLHLLQRATEQFAKGDYSARVEPKQADEIGQLSQAFNEMAQAVETEDARKKEFLAIVSHELRTPLSSLVGYSQSLVDGSLDQKHHEEVFQLLATESQRMKKLTENLLVVARNENMELVPQPLVAADLVDRAARILDQKAHLKAIKFVIQADDSLIIWSDEQASLQILLNSMENALNYSEQNSTLTIRVSKLEESALFEIIDTGIGIAAHHLPYITNRFYRVNAARSSSDGGSGLGLTIVKQLIEASGGTLHITSELTVGTSVAFTLPLWKEAE
ncbi:HAMP domain-containing sensor histidine kinase [Chryseomicrobium sp. FSL W7-1435]|uniref:HAMP domain-containing sensor histidine kinase n=1 Tax=Chryseomicrobium sp. FSL W7-1435 TaxID=2921704 RepID=UPI00315AEEE1